MNERELSAAVEELDQLAEVLTELVAESRLTGGFVIRRMNQAVGAGESRRDMPGQPRGRARHDHYL